MIKKIATYLGLFFFALLVAGAAFLGYVFYKGQGIDRASKAYAEVSIEKLTRPWSKEELVFRASPELILTLGKEEEFNKVFSLFQSLGPLKKMGELKGHSTMAYKTDKNKTITAKYVTTSDFENAQAEITIHLINKNDEWKISSFNVNSKYFIDKIVND